MDASLRKHRTEKQQLELDKQHFVSIKIGLITYLWGNFIFLAFDSLGSSYRNIYILYCYWIVWLAQGLIILYSHKKDKPNILRILNFFIVLRNIMPWFNFEDRKNFDDMAYVVQWSTQQNLCLQALIVCVAVTEKYYVHIPVSIVFQMLMSYGQLCLSMQKIGIENRFEYVIKEKRQHFIAMTIQFLLAEYVCALTVMYIMNQQLLILN